MCTSVGVWGCFGQIRSGEATHLGGNGRRRVGSCDRWSNELRGCRKALGRLLGVFRVGTRTAGDDPAPVPDRCRRGGDGGRAPKDDLCDVVHPGLLESPGLRPDAGRFGRFDPGTVGRRV